MKKPMREVWAECVLADKANSLYRLEADEGADAYLFSIKKKIPWEIARTAYDMYENTWFAVWHGEKWEVCMSYQEAYRKYQEWRNQACQGS